jgi:hypothetical protein
VHIVWHERRTVAAFKKSVMGCFIYSECSFSSGVLKKNDGYGKMMDPGGQGPCKLNDGYGNDSSRVHYAKIAFS